MTIDEQIKAVNREIDYRKRLYPVWVKNGKITEIEANYQLEVMKAVLNTLLQVKDFKQKLIC